MRILLVEDDALLADGLARALGQSGYLVDIASDGKTADSWIESEQFDLAILDLSLPGMGGIELTRRILQRQPEACILAFSMHRDPLYAAQAVRAGALGYVTKSSSPDVPARPGSRRLPGKTSGTCRT